jgi:hypothetical protein
VGELEEEVYNQKAAHEEADRLAAERAAAELAAAEAADRERAAEEAANRARLGDELINTKAYLLWIDAGRPDGADFGPSAYTALLEAWAGGR